MEIYKRMTNELEWFALNFVEIIMVRMPFGPQKSKTRARRGFCRSKSPYGRYRQKIVVS